MRKGERAVSLLSSCTEIVCALGLEKRLVGRSHECDYPEWVKSLPQCTEIKIDPLKPSKEIDRDVRALVEEGLSVYRVDASKLNSLKPDLLLTQTQCEVCAVSPKDLTAAVCEVITTKPNIVSLHPNRLNDLFTDIQKVAEAFGERERGEELCRKIRENFAELRERAAFSVVAKFGRPLSVACIEWIDPLMISGHWMPELLEIAGAEMSLESRTVTLDELRESKPDIILVMPCGFDDERAEYELEQMQGGPNGDAWKALSEDFPVFVLDGNSYFNRPGPRLVDSAEILIELFESYVSRILALED